MEDEVFLVRPDVKYKDTYLEGRRELKAYVKNTGEEFSKEFEGLDLDEIGKDFDGYVNQKLSLDRDKEERPTKYDMAPDDVKKTMSEKEIESAKAVKAKPVAEYWIMRKESDGSDKYIGEISIRTNELSDKDIRLGAKEYEDWKGSMGDGVKVGAETASFFIPSERGKKYSHSVRAQFFEELKKRGVETVVGKVALNNEKSNGVQENLRKTCGGAVYETELKGKKINRYIINVAPEKLREKAKLKEMIGGLRSSSGAEKQSKAGCESLKDISKDSFLDGR